MLAETGGYVRLPVCGGFFLRLEEGPAPASSLVVSSANLVLSSFTPIITGVAYVEFLSTMLCAFAVGASLGSFANVCILRLPAGESVITPASHCRSCMFVLPWMDKLPILSYAITRGQCRTCRVRISTRYPVVEFITACLITALFAEHGMGFEFLTYSILGVGLVVVAFIDFDHQVIPDVISLPGVIFGIGIAVFSPQIRIWESVGGAALGAGILAAVRGVYWFVTRTEGMGRGDVRLLAMIGAFLGWESVPFTLLVGSVVGSAVGISMMIANKRDLKMRIPFGPFLAVGALCYIFFGNAILHWYFGIS